MNIVDKINNNLTNYNKTLDNTIDENGYPKDWILYSYVLSENCLSALKYMT